MPLNIFFSHGTKDHEWVQEIAAKIENEEIEIYFYERDSQPGRSISDKLQQAIDSCDVAVVLLTKRSHASPYVQQEIGYAEGKGKLVIPLVEKGTPRRSLGMLEGREYVPFSRVAVEESVVALTNYLSNRIVQAKAKGLTHEQITALILALILAALLAYILYAAFKE